MRPTTTQYGGKLFVFSLLSLADLGLTLHLLSQGGGRVYESNPIAGAWLEAFGWAGLAAFKILMVFLVAGACVVIARYRPVVAGRVLQLACLATGSVVVYSFFLSGAVSPHPAPMKLAAAMLP